jgi:hypothetical protein
MLAVLLEGHMPAYGQFAKSIIDLARRALELGGEIGDGRRAALVRERALDGQADVLNVQGET